MALEVGMRVPGAYSVTRDGVRQDPRAIRAWHIGEDGELQGVTWEEEE